MPAPVRMPVSGIPDLHGFKRHLWRFRDETGESPLSPPPSWMFHYLVEGDEAELRLLRPFVDTLRESFDYRERLVMEQFHGDTHLVYFADIEVLHAWLVMLLCRADRSSLADEIVRFVMQQLGFEPSWKR